MLRKTIGVFFAVLSGIASIAQTTSSSINYGSLPGTQCNVMGGSPNISGFTHTTVVGQPQRSPESLLMPVQLSGGVNKKTGFRIALNTVPGDSWSFSAGISAATFGKSVRLSAYTATATPTSNNCSGGATIDIYTALTNGNMLNTFTTDMDVSPTFFNFSFVATTTTTYLVLIAENEGPSTDATNLKLWSLDWSRVHPPNPGTYSITSSQNSRACMNTNPITFTLNRLTNPDNNTVSSYRVYPEANQWLESGSYIDVSPSSPTVTLHPLQCATNLKLSAQALIGSTYYDITPKTIANTVPGWPFTVITGPDTIKSFGSATASASYSLNLGAYSACSVPTWSFSAGDMTYIQSVSNTPTAPFTGTVTKKPFIYGPSVTLKATANTCGINTTFSKAIYLDWGQCSICPMSENRKWTNADKISIAPNPSSGLFHVTCNKIVENGYFTVRMLDGREIQNKPLKNVISFDVDVTNFPAGFYIISTYDGNETTTQKIIKQ